MKIDRSKIIEKLFEFSQNNSGIIIGKPGIGKSYSIAQLIKILAKNEIPSLIIPIDYLLDGSTDSINAFIKTDYDWIKYLDQIEINQKDAKAVLIFDAFDAARDEKKRKQILNQINRSIKELKKWNTIVTVRTYDALKSPELIRLFKNNDLKNEISCRHFEIQELSNDELNCFFETNSYIKMIFEKAENKLKTILRIPFFLKLLEIVTIDLEPSELDKIKLIKSETELLNLFWEKKISHSINSSEKESLLKKIADCLVNNNTLNHLKDNFDFHTLVYNELISDDIICEVGVNNKYLSFSHNILFDYFIARLSIPDKADDFINFLSYDKSRAFFLRPSFVYFFTNLWYYYRITFWDIINSLDKEDDTHIVLFRRLIPLSVIANEYENINDIKTFLVNPSHIKHLLESIIFLSDRVIGNKDIELLLYLSNILDKSFLWEFALVNQNAIGHEALYLENKNKIGILSRKYVEFILTNRNTSNNNEKLLYDRLGSLRGIDFICRTYSSNIEESKKIIRNILDILDEKLFEIRYFTKLADNIKYFVSDDPAFVSEIYIRIISHKEESRDETFMGSSTLPLTSNRKQDYEMCFYRLNKFFPQFLKIAPQIAIGTGLTVCNDFIKKEKIRNSTPTTSIISINSFDYNFSPDMSAIWHKSLDYYSPAKLVEHIIEYFREIVGLSKGLEEDFISKYFENCLYAFSWKKIIEFFNDYSKNFTDYLFQLICNQIILISSDTVYEIGVSISNIYSLVDSNQQKEIENSILKIIIGKSGDEEKYLINIAKRLLSCIPKELIHFTKSEELLDSGEKFINTPVFSSSPVITEPYTTKMYLSDQGVNVTQNEEMLDLLDKVEIFNNNNFNKIPVADDFKNIAPIVYQLFNDIYESKNSLDNPLKQAVLLEIEKFFSVSTRNPDNYAPTEYPKIYKIILFGLKNHDFTDNSFDKTRSVSYGYSPTPKIEAVSTLTQLFVIKKHSKVIRNIKTFSKDPNPIIRFNTLKNIKVIWKDRPRIFWNIIFNRLTHENDVLTMSSLLKNIFSQDIIQKNTNNFYKAIFKASNRISDFDTGDGFIESYVNILLFLFIKNKDVRAKRILYNNIKYIPFSQSLVFRLFDYIDPKNIDNDYSINGTRDNLISLLLEITDINLLEIKNCTLEQFTQKDEIGKERLRLIDSIVYRIYFSLEVNENIRNNKELHPTEENKKHFYIKIKPILKKIIKESDNIDTGILPPSTAHNIIQILNSVIRYVPEEKSEILDMIYCIIKLSQKSGYLSDYSAMEEIVRFTEVLISDHKDLLKDNNSLDKITTILSIYLENGWSEAMKLLGDLDKAFR